MKPTKKLIEVSLPLDAINKASARAVIFAQMVDDRSAYIDVLRSNAKLKRKAEARLKVWEEARALFEKAQAPPPMCPSQAPSPPSMRPTRTRERERLFAIARDEIWQSWCRTCAAKREEIEDRSEWRERGECDALSGDDSLEQQQQPQDDKFLEGDQLPDFASNRPMRLPSQSRSWAYQP